MQRKLVIEVSQASFAIDVLRQSLDVPVLVDFWAPWCGPCLTLTPILEKLAVSYAGRFILAKCNIDDQVALAEKYGIQGIPNCKLFIDGAPVDEFQGVQSVAQIKQFLEQHCPDPAQEPLQLAKNHLAAGESGAAMALLQALFDQDSSQDEIRILLARATLQSHDFNAAEQLLLGLPKAHPESENLSRMISYARSAAVHGSAAACAAKVLADPEDFEARYNWGIALSLEDRYEEAIQRFLEIISKKRQYGDGKVRQALLALFEVLGQDHELVLIYRRKLASLLH